MKRARHFHEEAREAMHQRATADPRFDGGTTPARRTSFENVKWMIGGARFLVTGPSIAFHLSIPVSDILHVQNPTSMNEPRSGYQDVKPPSASTIEPVRRLAASEARKWTTEAISSGRPRRPIGVSRSQSFVFSSSPSTVERSGVSI